MNTVNFLSIFIAYLIGSLSFAVIVSKIMGMADPRTYGSHNPGATNVLRSGKKVAAALTLLGDALKGCLAVFLAMAFRQPLGADETIIATVAVAVLLGHMWPIFFGFKGGKGVATALGILLALSWPTALLCAVVWLVMAFGFKISSLAALIATLISPFATAYFTHSHAYTIAVVVIAILVLLRHHRNIADLWKGREGKIGDREPSE